MSSVSFAGRRADEGPRVLGYVMARDEWPAVGLSVVHALTMGVDVVTIADHQSTDETPRGLEALARAWPGRINVHRIETDSYLQEATTVLMMAESRAEAFDWVYVFDADEFGLPGHGINLADLLAGIPQSVDAVRYEVHNWVAPVDMDDSDIAQYERLQHRARPSHFLELSPETMHDEISSGHINFFDVHFLSKVIVRSRCADALLAGAHSVAGSRHIREMAVDAGTFRVAHVPFRSRAALLRKCDQGRSLVSAGFPADQGWQAQMLAHLETAGRIEDFWQSHSIGEFAGECWGTAPSTEIDDSLAVAMRGAIPALHDSLSRPTTTDDTAPSPEDIGVAQVRGVAVAAIHRLVKERNQLTAERDRLDDESRETAARIAAANVEISAVVEQRDMARRRQRELRASTTYRVGLTLMWPLRVLMPAVRASMKWIRRRRAS